jgi:hypothetical protein
MGRTPKKLVKKIRPSGKTSSVNVLRRWIDLDAALRGFYGDGWDLRDFAEEHGVDRRTVVRDLAAFESLGQSVECFVDPVTRVRVWGYPVDQPPLFAVNLDRRAFYRGPRA